MTKHETVIYRNIGAILSHFKYVTPLRYDRGVFIVPFYQKRMLCNLLWCFCRDETAQFEKMQFSACPTAPGPLPGDPGCERCHRRRYLISFRDDTVREGLRDYICKQMGGFPGARSRRPPGKLCNKIMFTLRSVFIFKPFTKREN